MNVAPMKTDLDIQRDVLTELRWDPAVNAAVIEVAVDDGIVTLSGQTASYAQTCAAQLAAQRVHGVRGLKTALDVTPSASGRRADADIARSAETSLAWNACLSQAHLQVRVEDGWLTLTGEVDQPYERRTAELAVRYLLGVTGISNNITIKDSTTSDTIQSDIEATLTRRDLNDSKTIRVAVDGSTVTLSGSVKRSTERDVPAHVAWSTAGVHRVVDNVDVQ